MIVRTLAANGAHIYTTSRRNLADFVKTIPVANVGFVRALPPADLSSRAGAEAMAKSLGDAGVTAVDALINNSGASWGEPLESHSEAGWDRVNNLNVKGAFYATTALLPLLRAGVARLRAERGPTASARVVFIGSVMGVSPAAMAGVEAWGYAASKAAVHHLSRVLAARLAPEGVLVNAIALGPVDGGMLGSVLRRGEAVRNELASTVPAGRLGGVADVSGPVAFLLSDAAQWVAGAVLPVDGGALSKM